jgi:hypothetical protein
VRSLCCFVTLLLLSARTLSASIVTFTLSYHDNGSGVIAFNQWAVYASASADSAGLFEYSVDLLPFTGTILNRGNGVIMEDSGSGDQLNLGFTAGRHKDPAQGQFSGRADLDAGAAFRPVYGIGQEPGDLDNFIPSNFDTQLSTSGSGRAAYGIETYAGRNLFLLARGSWTGQHPEFDKLSPDSSAKVYVSRAGVQNTSAPVVYDYRGPEPPPRNFVGIGNTADAGSPTNVAAGGAIAVQGANGRYASEVDDLAFDAVTRGHAPILTIGDEPGSLYVMARLNGSPADINALLNLTTADVGPEDPEFAKLHAAYDARFAAGGFNALFKYPNILGPKIFSWDFGGPGVSMDQLAVVPEPAMLLPILACCASILRCRAHKHIRRPLT